MGHWSDLVEEEREKEELAKRQAVLFVAIWLNQYAQYQQAALHVIKQYCGCFDIPPGEPALDRDWREESFCCVKETLKEVEELTEKFSETNFFCHFNLRDIDLSYVGKLLLCLTM